MDFLEKWRSARTITGFNLVAHSFGGYLAGLYNVRYP
jgi:pimeloyl-ACP methyl ester carboxylesterase